MNALQRLPCPCFFLLRLQAVDKDTWSNQYHVILKERHGGISTGMFEYSFYRDKNQVYSGHFNLRGDSCDEFSVVFVPLCNTRLCCSTVLLSLQSWAASCWPWREWVWVLEMFALRKSRKVPWQYTWIFLWDDIKTAPFILFFSGCVCGAWNDRWCQTMWNICAEQEAYLSQELALPYMSSWKLDVRTHCFIFPRWMAALSLEGWQHRIAY